MDFSNPLQPAFEFFLALYANMPVTYKAFISLLFVVFLMFSVFRLIYKIRS